MPFTAEQKEHILRRIPYVPKGFMRDYVVASVEGTLPTYYFHVFSFMKSAYSDELPEKDITGATEQGEYGTKQVYKCQTTYITGLGSGLNSAVTNGVIKGEKLIEAIREFRKIATVDKFQVGDPKNVERLARVNGILDRVITYLAPIGTPEQRAQSSSR